MRTIKITSPSTLILSNPSRMYLWQPAIPPFLELQLVIIEEMSYPLKFQLPAGQFERPIAIWYTYTTKASTNTTWLETWRSIWSQPLPYYKKSNESKSLWSNYISIHIHVSYCHCHLENLWEPTNNITRDTVILSSPCFHIFLTNKASATLAVPIMIMVNHKQQICLPSSMSWLLDDTNDGQHLHIVDLNNLNQLKQLLLSVVIAYQTFLSMIGPWQQLYIVEWYGLTHSKTITIIKRCKTYWIIFNINFQPDTFYP